MLSDEQVCLSSTFRICDGLYFVAQERAWYDSHRASLAPEPDADGNAEAEPDGKADPEADADG